jgi:hypothetical protein
MQANIESVLAPDSSEGKGGDTMQVRLEQLAYLVQERFLGR